jgi:hypothetical protein
MSKIDALSIYLTNNDLDQLKELDGEFIDLIQKSALSEKYKNQKYSGNPESGSVAINRFVNAQIDDYGTARGLGEGKKFKNQKVTVQLTDYKELIEEIETLDLELHPVGDIIGKRQQAQASKVATYLDREFFNAMKDEGTKVTITETDIEKKLEALIQSVETTVNDFVDGVDRSDLVLFLTPAEYAKVRDYLDVITLPNIDSTSNVISMFRDVVVESNFRQEVPAICAINGAVAQPVRVKDYTPETIPLSEAIAVSKFFNKGTKVITPDLVKYYE